MWLYNSSLKPHQINQMASSFCFPKQALAIFFLNIATIFSCVFSYQFEVGGDNGWTTPSSANFTTDADDPYNVWAGENRFRIGDTLHFRYQNDSVLVVGNEDYKNCTMSNHISEFDDGDTVFEFKRSGFFYFISGQPDHCKEGQKLIIRVIHPSEDNPRVHSPQSAPSPGVHGWHPPGAANSATGLSVITTTYAMTALASLLIVHPSGSTISATRLSAVTTYAITAFASILMVLYLFI